MFNKKISKTAYKILLLHVLFISATVLTSSFINVLLWRLRSDLGFIAYFDLMIAITTLLGIVLSAILLTRIKSNTIFRLAFSLIISSYGFILYFQQDLINHLYLLGILYGLGNGLYWGTYNLIKLRETNNQNREHFFGMIHGFFSVVATVFPSISGFIIVFLPKITSIELAGYYFLYALSIGLFLTLMGYVETLPNYTIEYFKLRNVIKKVNSKTFRNISMNELLSGIFETGSKMVLVVFSFLILKNELNLGLFSSLFSLLSGLYIYLVGRKIDIKKRSEFILIGAISIFLGRLVFIRFLTLESLILDRIFEIIGSPLFGLPLVALILSSIEHRSNYKIEREEEYLIAREIPLNFGRFFGSLFFIIFLSIFGSNNIRMIKLWFFIISTAPILQWYFINKLAKEKA